MYVPWSVWICKNIYRVSVSWFMFHVCTGLDILAKGALVCAMHGVCV